MTEPMCQSHCLSLSWLRHSWHFGVWLSYERGHIKHKCQWHHHRARWRWHNHGPCHWYYKELDNSPLVDRCQHPLARWHMGMPNERSPNCHWIRRVGTTFRSREVWSWNSVKSLILYLPKRSDPKNPKCLAVGLSVSPARVTYSDMTQRHLSRPKQL